MTFLECCVDSGVLELFLNVFLVISMTFHEHHKYVLELFLNLFLIISKTFLKYNVFMNCSYICSWLFQRQPMNIIKCVLDYFKDLS